MFAYCVREAALRGILQTAAKHAATNRLQRPPRVANDLVELEITATQRGGETITLAAADVPNCVDKSSVWCPRISISYEALGSD